MSAIPLDSDPIFCRDTIICAAAADEDDDNKLESTADITNRDRSEEDARAQTDGEEGS